MAVMATQRIINGPSRWDIMLSFFEDKPITFTLKEGVIVKVSSLFCMWNMAGYEPLVGEVNQWDDAGRAGLSESYLLRGFVGPDYKHGFIEYHLRSRTGLCIVLEDHDLPDEYGFLPDYWSKAMGIEDGNYS